MYFIEIFLFKVLFPQTFLVGMVIKMAVVSSRTSVISYTSEVSSDGASTSVIRSASDVISDMIHRVIPFKLWLHMHVRHM